MSKYVQLAVLMSAHFEEFESNFAVTVRKESLNKDELLQLLTSSDVCVRNGAVVLLLRHFRESMSCLEFLAMLHTGCLHEMQAIIYEYLYALPREKLDYFSMLKLPKHANANTEAIIQHLRRKAENNPATKTLEFFQ